MIYTNLLVLCGISQRVWCKKIWDFSKFFMRSEVKNSWPKYGNLTKSSIWLIIYAILSLFDTFLVFLTFYILGKSLGPLRDLTQSSMQNNLRFNKNLLEIISEEIKPNCEISENLTSVYHFGRFLVEFDMFWCFDFSCFGKYIMVFCGISQRFRRKKIWELLNYSIRSQMNNPLPKSRKLENRHFSHIMTYLSPFRVYNWQFLDFRCLCKSTRCSAGSHRGSAGKKSEIYQNFSSDRKWGNHCSNSRIS